MTDIFYFAYKFKVLEKVIKGLNPCEVLLPFVPRFSLVTIIEAAYMMGKQNVEAVTKTRGEGRFINGATCPMGEIPHFV